MNVNENPFYLFVDSDDRVSGTPSNFEVEFDNLSAMLGKECRVQLVSVEVPLGAIYQVTEGKNTFAFSVNGSSTISFDITPGTYSVNSLTDVIKERMETLDSVNNTYVFSYNQDTNKITLTPTYASGTLQLRCNLSSPEVNNILGLPDDLVTIGNNTAYPFPNQVNMIPNYNFYLLCDQIYSRNLGSGVRNHENALIKMSLSHRFTRSIIHYSDFDTYSAFIRSFRGRMRFSIVQDNGEVAVIPSNMKTTLTLKIFPA